MAADKLEDRGNFAAVFNGFCCGKGGSKLMKENVPGGVSRFVGEIWMFASGALAPAGQAFRTDFRKQHAPITRDAETGFKRTKKGNMKFAENTAVYFPDLDE